MMRLLNVVLSFQIIFLVQCYCLASEVSCLGTPGKSQEVSERSRTVETLEEWFMATSSQRPPKVQKVNYSNSLRVISPDLLRNDNNHVVHATRVLESEREPYRTPTSVTSITTTTTPSVEEVSFTIKQIASNQHQSISSSDSQASHLLSSSALNHNKIHQQQHQLAPNPSSPKPIPQHYQVKSLLNVTHDYPLAYSQIICGYVWPLMAAITLFTNLMIVFVLTQADMRTPTNVVLTAIAIADIIPIIVPVPWFVYLFALGNENQVLYPPLICYFYQHSTRSVSEIFYFLSTWLNVLLAIQDYLTACWPKLASRYCTIRVVISQICSLTILAFLLNLPQALKLVFKPIQFYYQDKLTHGCRRLQAKWFKDLVGEYAALYDDIFTGIIVIFVDGGPALVLIILTALLIRQLQRQRIEGLYLMQQARTASKRRREQQRQQEVESSARVLIFVLLAFLAVKIPFATTYTLMIIQSRFEIHFVENLLDFQRAITITDIVFVLSYPVNFTIFCCCSKRFRHKCMELLAQKHREISSGASNQLHHRRLQILKEGGSAKFSLDSTFDDATTIDGSLREGDFGSINKQCKQEQQHFAGRIPSIQVESVDEGAEINAASAQPRDSTTSVINEDDQHYVTPTEHQRAQPAPIGCIECLAMASNRASNELMNQVMSTDPEAATTLCYECILSYERLRQRRASSLMAEFSQEELAGRVSSVQHVHYQQQREQESDAENQVVANSATRYFDHASELAAIDRRASEGERQVRDGGEMSGSRQAHQHPHSQWAPALTRSESWDSHASSLFCWPMPPDLRLTDYQRQQLQTSMMNQRGSLLDEQNQLQHSHYHHHRQQQINDYSEPCSASSGPQSAPPSSCQKQEHDRLAQSQDTIRWQIRSGSDTSRKTIHGFTEHQLQLASQQRDQHPQQPTTSTSTEPINNNSDDNYRKNNNNDNNGNSSGSTKRQFIGPMTLASWWAHNKRDSTLNQRLLAPELRSLSLSDSKVSTLTQATGFLADAILAIFEPQQQQQQQNQAKKPKGASKRGS